MNNLSPTNYATFQDIIHSTYQRIQTFWIWLGQLLGRELQKEWASEPRPVA